MGKRQERLERNIGRESGNWFADMKDHLDVASYLETVVMHEIGNTHQNKGRDACPKRILLVRL